MKHLDVKHKITIVFVNRNRSKVAIENCINSIKPQMCNVIIVDYGSDKSNRKYLNNLKNVNIIKVDRNVGIFNKARALNVALRDIKTKYVIFSDIDLIFDDNFIQEIQKVFEFEKKPLVLCRKTDLKEDGKILCLHSVSAVGCCLGLKTEDAINIHGFDEYYLGWGFEDIDFHDRCIEYGLNTHWIDDYTTIKHQWHEMSDRRYLKQNGEYYKRMKYLRNFHQWGML